MEDVLNATNNHDAKALAGTWAIDGDLRASDGAMVKGRVAIEKHYGVLFAADRLKDAKATYTSTAENRYLGANVAIINATAEVSGAEGSRRERQPDLHAAFDGGCREAEWHLADLERARLACERDARARTEAEDFVTREAVARHYPNVAPQCALLFEVISGSPCVDV
jgi:uncharacterized protein (TIGR02246 family)